MIERIKLLFKTKENLETMNKELIEKSFKDEKEIAELKEKVEELSLHIHFKDETIRSLNNKLRDLEKSSLKLVEKEQPKKRGRKAKCSD